MTNKIGSIPQPSSTLDFDKNPRPIMSNMITALNQNLQHKAPLTADLAGF